MRKYFDSEFFMDFAKVTEAMHCFRFSNAVTDNKVFVAMGYTNRANVCFGPLFNGKRWY